MWKPDPELCPYAGLRPGLDGATERLGDQVADDREPEAGAALHAARREERVEDARQRLLRDAPTVVAYGQLEHLLAGRVDSGRDRNVDAPAGTGGVGVAFGVCQQVDDHLTEHAPVACPGGTLRDGALEPDPQAGL